MARTKFGRIRPHCNIGTIGHVDHGKTTPIVATTKVFHGKYPDLNGLSPFDSINKAPEKRQRGIAISVVYVEYQAEKRYYAHVDCPGHAGYVKNMITGAVQMDGAILVVAATDGPMVQTYEHTLLVHQVGVPAIVVAFNECDMITKEDTDLTDLIEMEFHEILSVREFNGNDLPIVRMAALPALNGDEKWAGTILELIDAVDEYIPQPERDTEKPFLIPVEDVFTIAGRDTVITGRIERNVVEVGGTVGLVGIRPERQTTTVTGAEVFRKVLDKDRTGENVSLLLRGTKKKGMERDMVVIKPGPTTPYTDSEATVYVLSKEEGGRHKPFFSNYFSQFYFRIIDITGVVQLPEGKGMVMSSDNIDMIVHLNKPIAMEENLKFVTREGGRIVGAGKVTKTIK